MSQERVDKKWIERGIDQYSTAAIFGTLSHYGVSLTEAAFLELTKEHFPLAIAQLWHEHWKGTGQFSRFPAAAAEQLWSRLKPGEIAPTDLALGLISLLGTLSSALDDKTDDGTWETRFKVVEAYLPKIPGPEEKRQRFLAETLAAIGEEWADVFDGMAEALMKKGQGALAERMASIEELLFPEHVGVTRALLAVAKGDTAAGFAQLSAIANDTARTPFARLGAASSLLDHEQVDAALGPLNELLDLAEKDRDADLASQAVEQLDRVVKMPGRKDLPKLRERIEKLIAAFGA